MFYSDNPKIILDQWVTLVYSLSHINRPILPVIHIVLENERTNKKVVIQSVMINMIKCGRK